MANIITPETKKQRDSLMRGRFVLVAALMLMFVAIVALIALAPAYVAVRIEHSALMTNTAQEIPPEAKQDQEIATKTGALLQALNPIINATSSPSGVIVSTLAVKPAGVSITGMTYAPGTLTLTGQASQRETLNAFRMALEKSGLFTNVSIPVAALVGAQDGKFTVTLKGAF